MSTSSSSPPSGCMGLVEESEDACTITTDYTCPEPSVPGTVTWTGSFEWAGDGESGAGVLQLTIRDEGGAVLCSSTYDVEAEQL